MALGLKLTINNKKSSELIIKHNGIETTLDIGDVKDASLGTLEIAVNPVRRSYPRKRFVNLSYALPNNYSFFENFKLLTKYGIDQSIEIRDLPRGHCFVRELDPTKTQSLYDEITLFIGSLDAIAPRTEQNTVINYTIWLPDGCGVNINHAN